MQCDNKCHEDYMEREYLEEPIRTSYNRYAGTTFYFCTRCSWRANWRPGLGLQVLDDGKLPELDSEE